MRRIQKVFVVSVDYALFTGCNEVMYLPTCIKEKDKCFFNRVRDETVLPGPMLIIPQFLHSEAFLSGLYITNKVKSRPI